MAAKKKRKTAKRRSKKASSFTLAQLAPVAAGMTRIAKVKRKAGKKYTVDKSGFIIESKGPKKRRASKRKSR